MMNKQLEAIVYCEGAFNTPNGKTAHGLVRFTKRYRVTAVIDSHYAGQDAGTVLDDKPNGIPIAGSIDDALENPNSKKAPPTHMVIGLAPDGGRLGYAARKDVTHALARGLNIDSGLHDFLSDDPAIAAVAKEHGSTIRDIRKSPPQSQLHFFSGRIEEVKALKVAVLGTDSAIGKRTTAWKVVESLIEAGCRTEMIGTGQTAWLQGARHSIMLDTLINDFLTGEIEHAVVSAWNDAHPDVIVIEGQGGLLNPAYPGGYEIIAAARPDVILLQHAPARKEYDGFPDYPIQPISRQIQAVEIISGKPVVALTINHEGITPETIPLVCETISQATGLPAVDVLIDGATAVAQILAKHVADKHKSNTKEEV